MKQIQKNRLHFIHCTKMKFSVKNFFSKCKQIPRKLEIRSHMLKKSLTENFVSFELIFFKFPFKNYHFRHMWIILTSGVTQQKHRQTFYIFLVYKMEGFQRFIWKSSKYLAYHSIFTIYWSEKLTIFYCAITWDSLRNFPCSGLV